MKQEELFIAELQKLGLKKVKIERNGGKRLLFLLFSNGNKVKMSRCGTGICVSSKEDIEVDCDLLRDYLLSELSFFSNYKNKGVTIEEVYELNHFLFNVLGAQEDNELNTIF